ncbi:unnamed protein product [Moneuplotes crassus]|uniref:Uncharacterized protein n=1 Tax=Euplotes crassus TaxID=5936 RepID=A0AAD1UB48_EUPCR|nr:unnamed protein product [Moneuplotes crassus]
MPRCTTKRELRGINTASNSRNNKVILLPHKHSLIGQSISQQEHIFQFLVNS